MAHRDLVAKWTDFGWHAISVDGNDLDELHRAFEEAKTVKGKPTIIIANTIKGYGSPVMEDKANWHHKVPNEEELAQIRKDLEERREAAING